MSQLSAESHTEHLKYQTPTSDLISPSYLINVLTLATSMSYSFFTACLIWCLFALTSTMKTRVLLSSIFFIADSVVKGNLIMA